MRVLGIEAATRLAGAAVVEIADARAPGAAAGAPGAGGSTLRAPWTLEAAGARLLAETVHDVHRAPAERLLAQVETALRDAGASLAEIDIIGVSAGPGSFTGIRVGLATAQGLGAGAGRPVVAVPSLAALAAPWALAGAPVLAFLDARRGEVYYALFSGQTSEIDAADVAGAAARRDYGAAAAAAGAAAAASIPEPATGPGAARPEALADRIAAALPAAGAMAVVGSGAALCRAALEEVWPGRFSYPGGAADAPRPAWTAVLAAGLHRVRPEPPEPIYVRRSDAEEARHGRDRR